METWFVVEQLAPAILIAVNCISCFDWSKGNKFSTYITWSLNREWKDWVRETGESVIRNNKHLKRVNPEELHGPSSPLDRVIQPDRVSFNPENQLAVLNVLSEMDEGDDEDRKHAAVLRLRNLLSGHDPISAKRPNIRPGNKVLAKMVKVPLKQIEFLIIAAEKSLYKRLLSVGV